MTEMALIGVHLVQLKGSQKWVQSGKSGNEKWHSWQNKKIAKVANDSGTWIVQLWMFYR